MNASVTACVAATVALLAGGCQTTIPPEALALQSQAGSLRQLQSRRFDTGDEKKILAACAALLQDLGFTIEESCSDLGLVVASKERSAVETSQIVLSLFFGTPHDANQRFRTSLVTRPSEDKRSVMVRVTFQRTVWNTQRQITRNEPLNKSEHYQEFFQKLSKAVFLEANDL